MDCAFNFNSKGIRIAHCAVKSASGHCVLLLCHLRNTHVGVIETSGKLTLQQTTQLRCSLSPAAVQVWDEGHSTTAVVQVWDEGHSTTAVVQVWDEGHSTTAVMQVWGEGHSDTAVMSLRWVFVGRFFFHQTPTGKIHGSSTAGCLAAVQPVLGEFLPSLTGTDPSEAWWYEFRMSQHPINKRKGHTHTHTHRLTTRHTNVEYLCSVMCLCSV